MNKQFDTFEELFNTFLKGVHPRLLPDDPEYMGDERAKNIRGMLRMSFGDSLISSASHFCFIFLPSHS